MPRIRQSAAFLALAGVLAIGTAHATCKQLDPKAPGAHAVELGIPLVYAENASRAYKGISAAAKVDLPFYICRSPEPNAAEVERGGKRIVLITTALLELAKGDTDEIAAVLGHEFGHLLHRHISKKQQHVQDSLVTAKRQAVTMVRRGADVSTAVDSAKYMLVDRVTAFSRAAEREADDQGFALTQVAGFDPAGARRFFERMAKLKGDDQKGWFATHPGWQERISYSARLELNESFRRVAELHVDNPVELAKVVLRWDSAMPDSGAAAYYRSLMLVNAKKPVAVVSGALEDAVLNYDGDGLSSAGQSHQSERAAAELALCVALWKEGRKTNAVACVRRLDREDVVQFKKITGWNEIILVGPRREAGGSLYGARSEEDHVVLTNCPQTARSEGLQPVRSWKGMRPAKSGDAEPTAASCSRNFCDCEAIDLAERFPDLFKAR